jgi:hypothetical protein
MGQVEPENHEMVSIFFADIVNYTVMCSTLRADKASDLYENWDLDDLLSQFEMKFLIQSIKPASSLKTFFMYICQVYRVYSLSNL